MEYNNLYTTKLDEKFIDGICIGSENPSVKAMLKLFYVFDKLGLIKDDLCFDPEHLIESVIKYHWNDYNEKGELKNEE